MNEIHHYHVTMLITVEQEDAIKSVFKSQNWPCYLQVLPDETVADIIHSGFTDVFPLLPGRQYGSIGLSACTEIKSGVNSPETEAGSGSESCDTIEIETSNVSGDKEINMSAKDTQEFDHTLNSTKSAARRISKTSVAMTRNSAVKADNRTQRKNNRRRAQSDRQGYNCVLQCMDCKLRFLSSEDFWHHRNDVKHTLPTDNVPTKFNLEVYSMEEHKQMGFIKCDGCENYFLGKRRQMKHFYVVHRDLMPTPTCPICCQEFESHAELLKHKRDEGHRDSLSSLNNYQCDLCGKHMTSYSNFVQHKQFVCGIGEKEMEKIRIHACDLCGKLFKSPRHVRRHKKISHFKVAEVCDICGKVCKGRKALDVHKKRHDERNKKHVCSDCGKAFFTDSKLQEHIRTHTKEKPFKCPLCTYTCAVKPNIHKHAVNVHKQMVAAVDLRKTAVENTTIPSTRNIHENCLSASRNETFQNTSVSQELNRKDEEKRQTSLAHESSPSTYVGNELHPSIQGKGQINVEYACVSGPITNPDSDPDSELRKGKPHFTVAHKTIPDAYVGNDLNRNIQLQCEGRQVSYYSEQGRVEYHTYPPTDNNLGKYQAHIN